MNSVAVKINVKQISKSLFIKFVFHKGMDATILDLTCQPSVFSLVLSCHNKDLERRTLKPSAHHSSRVLDKLCYSSQTNQCYSSILFRRQQENPSLKRQSMSTQRQEEKRMEECASARERERENEKERTHTGEREREKALWLLLLYVFFLPLGLPYTNWVQPGVLFVLPEGFTLVLRPSFDFPLFYFRGLFLPCLLATAILDSYFLF